jgi:hypothetical protein
MVVPAGFAMPNGNLELHDMTLQLTTGLIALETGLHSRSISATFTVCALDTVADCALDSSSGNNWIGPGLWA